MDNAKPHTGKGVPKKLKNDVFKKSTSGGRGPHGMVGLQPPNSPGTNINDLGLDNIAWQEG